MLGRQSTREELGELRRVGVQIEDVPASETHAALISGAERALRNALARSSLMPAPRTAP